MLSQIADGKFTHIPFLSHHFEGYGHRRERKFTSVLESLYWQTLGWVHTPSFIRTKLDSKSLIKAPKSTAEYEKYQFHTKKSFEPKLQIENKVPYGVLPKDVATDIEKRRIAEQDLKSILHEMGIEAAAILPSVVIYKDDIVIVKSESHEGIPSQPFLDLDLFDDAWHFEAYSPDEWLALGDTEHGRKPLPGIAFLPLQKNHVTECLNFDWCKVMVVDYDAEKKLYLVNRYSNCRDKENSGLAYEEEGIWIPRIYLKFDAEEPLQFAKRLQTALSTRHAVEESLRINYFVECMPLENSPEMCKEDLDTIISIARRSSSLQPSLKWIEDHLTKSVQEIQLEYKRAYNYMCYTKIAQQIPHLIKYFKNKSLNVCENHYSTSEIKYDDPYHELAENFRCQTFFTCVEALQALTHVEINILTLRNLSLYNLSLDDTYTLEDFDTLQTKELEKNSRYIHNTWMTDISNAILLNLENCGKGQYDLNQKVLHAFKLTKLGKLLKMVTFKIQDAIRFLVLESLEEYATTIKMTCSNVMNVKDNFVWTDSLCSNEFGPKGKPIFEVPLEMKGDRLEFVINLRKYGETVRNLFDQGLRVTKDLPMIEKFVMKKMLHSPLECLESIRGNERHVVRWKMEVDRSMNRAMVAATAYIRAYDEPLKTFKTDHTNYVKELARSRANCDQLKRVIEMHHTEKYNLENTIPSFVDIGPFRLMTKSVRLAAIKKHEQLSEAVLGFFYTKLKQHMEHINNQFLKLLNRIEQPTGNMEDLLDKKQWCQSVPKKIEKLSEEVNRLRSDVKLISTFHCNMEDEDFNTFWQIQKLPQDSMKRLLFRISMFDGERIQHREHLNSDQEMLKTNLQKLRQTVAKFAQYSDVENASLIAIEVRKARKSLANLEEQSQLYQKREKLYGLPITNYQEILEISESLMSYEKFWLSTAEFKKYEASDDSELLTIDSSQLRKIFKEYQSNLSECQDLFPEKMHPAIHRSVLSVMKDIEEFIATRLP